MAETPYRYGEVMCDNPTVVTIKATCDAKGRPFAIEVNGVVLPTPDSLEFHEVRHTDRSVIAGRSAVVGRYMLIKYRLPSVGEYMTVTMEPER